jgi:2-polyprenyl-6-methoxyphenol hydroxylase-like FAD-dependent oxidoreductase
MNTGVQDAMAPPRRSLTTLTSGNEKPLSAYGAVRRPIAKQVMVLTDRLTRLAAVAR